MVTTKVNFFLFICKNISNKKTKIKRIKYGQGYLLLGHLQVNQLFRIL